MKGVYTNTREKSRLIPIRKKKKRVYRLEVIRKHLIEPDTTAVVVGSLDMPFGTTV